MTIFSDQIRNEFIRQGVSFNEIKIDVSAWLPRGITGTIIGAFIRYFIYPLKVLVKHKTNNIFISDSANASISTFLPKRKFNTVIFLHGLAYQIHHKDLDINADFKDRLIYFFSRLIKRPGLIKSNAIIANSQRGMDDYKNNLNPPATQSISYIPLGIDTSFKPVDTTYLRIKLGIADNERVILSVAAPDLRKNISILPEVFAGFKNNFPWKWIHIGGLHPSTFERIPPWLQNKLLNLELVPHSEMPTYYSMADVFVLPTLYDTFGWPPIEAAACGCPVVVSDIKPISENLENIAVLVDPRDKQTITKSMIKILTDPGFSRELKRKGLEVQKKFDWAHTSQHILDIIENTGQHTP